MIALEIGSSVETDTNKINFILQHLNDSEEIADQPKHTLAIDGFTLLHALLPFHSQINSIWILRAPNFLAFFNFKKYRLYL